MIPKLLRFFDLESEKNKVFGLFLLHCVAYGLQLLNYQGLYWDDWVVFDQDPAVLSAFMDQIQHGIKGTFIELLSEIGNGVWPFRIFVFFAYFLICLSFWQTLRFVEPIRPVAFLATMALSVVPMNMVRTYISVIPFVFPLLLFFLGISTYLWAHKNASRWPLLLAALLLLGSFSTGSILVLYGLFGLLMLYAAYLQQDSRMQLPARGMDFLKKNFVFLGLPFVYFVFKRTFAKPTGIYENYNSVEIQDPLSIFELMYYVWLDMIEDGAELFAHFTASSAILIALLAGLFASKLAMPMLRKRTALVLLGIGTLAVVAAMFPYLAVGKKIWLYGYQERFALLIPYGISLQIVAIVALCSGLEERLNLPFARAGFLFLILGWTQQNIAENLGYATDWFHQVGLSERFKENRFIQKHSTFVVSPPPFRTGLFHKNRKISYYEFNGLLKFTFGDTKRLMTKAVPKIQSASREHAHYNFKDWQFGRVIAVEFLKLKEMTTFEKLYLYYLYLTKYDYFKRYASELVDIKPRASVHDLALPSTRRVSTSPVYLSDSIEIIFEATTHKPLWRKTKVISNESEKEDYMGFNVQRSLRLDSHFDFSTYRNKKRVVLGQFLLPDNQTSTVRIVIQPSFVEIFVNDTLVSRKMIATFELSLNSYDLVETFVYSNRKDITEYWEWGDLHINRIPLREFPADTTEFVLEDDPRTL